jgi:hypothetical protein
MRTQIVSQGGKSTGRSRHGAPGWTRGASLVELEALPDTRGCDSKAPALAGNCWRGGPTAKPDAGFSRGVRSDLVRVRSLGSCGTDARVLLGAQASSARGTTIFRLSRAKVIAPGIWAGRYASACRVNVRRDASQCSSPRSQRHQGRAETGWACGVHTGDRDQLGEPADRSPGSSRLRSLPVAARWGGACDSLASPQAALERQQAAPGTQPPRPSSSCRHNLHDISFERINPCIISAS